MAWGGVQDTFPTSSFREEWLGYVSGRSPGSRIIGQSTPSQVSPVALVLSSPVTVAGPRRIPTGFPIKDRVHLKRTTLSISHLWYNEYYTERNDTHVFP